MSMLDQLLIEGVRRTTPENKPWNAGQFLTNVGQFVNTNERINELQRQNSLRNLIKQREEDGVPFDRLSNEAAKYDLNKALTMRGEARDSIKFNRTESEAELANHKKTMAGWLGGIVLRRAQEAVASGDAKWDFDYVVNVCNEAAAAIFPYDPSTATALMNFGKQGLTKKATTTEKKGRDDEVRISSMMQNWGKIADTTQDPYNSNFNRILQYCANNVLLYKNADKANRWITTSDVNAVYNYMRDILGREKDPASPSNVSKALEILQGMSDVDIAKLLDNVNGNKNETPIDIFEKEGGPSVGKVSFSGVKNVDTNNLPRIAYSSRANGYRWTPNMNAIEPIQTAIDEAETVEDLKPVYDALGPGVNLQGEDNNVYNNLKNEADKKKAKIQEKLAKDEDTYGKDATPAFKKAFDKLVNSARTGTALNAQMTAFHSAVQNLEKSETQLSQINSVLVALLPFYKPTDFDAKQAEKVTSFKTFGDLQKYLGSYADVPILSSIANAAKEDDVVDAAIKDLTRNFNGMWNTMVEGATPEQAEEIRQGAISRWNLSPKDIKILQNGRLMVGKKRKEAQKKASLSYGDYYTNDDGVNVETISGRPVIVDKDGNITGYADEEKPSAAPASSGKKSAKEWLEERKKQKGGK